MRSTHDESSIGSQSVIRIFLSGLTVTLFALLGFANQCEAAPQYQKASSVLPKTTIAYVEIQNANQIVDTLLNHPLRKKLEAIPDVRKALRQPDFAMAQIALGMFETQMNESWEETLANVSGGGAYFAIDAKTEGMLLMLQARDEAKLKRAAGTILNWVKTEAEKKGEPVPFKTEDYRTGKIAKLDGAIIVRVGKWFLASNRPAFAKQVADNILDGTENRLDGVPNFLEAANSRRPSDQVWAYLDLDAIRERGIAKELFSGKANDAGEELLLGGLKSTLKSTPYATAAAQIENRGIDLRAALPHNPGNVEEARQFFYGTESSGRAPIGLKPANLIANLTSHRDIGHWWLSKEALFDENVIAELAQADSNLSTFFGGLDFGQEVLGSVQPKMQIVVTRQEADTNRDIKLPAFAIIGKLKNHEITQRRFKVAYQSLIGFVNIGLGQQGMPQLDLETMREGDSVISSATYLPDDLNESNSLVYNFSPTLAFHGETIVISSTRALAVELTELAKSDDGSAWQDSESNTALLANAALVKQSLEDNRQSLITQNMLEKGSNKEEASREIDLILSILDFVKDFDARFNVTSDQVELAIRLGFSPSTNQESK